MPEKTGVYICECGPNIKDGVDIGALVEFSGSLENVVLSRNFGLLCSKDGKGLIKKDIKEKGLTRVVIAACSPKEHEITFQNVLKDADLNPFYLQVANIREQCAWVVRDKKAATEKAKELIRAAVKRVAHHEPLEIKEIACNPDVLVLGAGIAGISAALTLAKKGRSVYLVEKTPVIGGRAARYEKVFPSLECASCMLDPLLDEVLHNKNIELITSGEVKEVSGFYGNFIIRINKHPGFVNAKTCIGCGKCVEACPVKVKNEYEEGLNERNAVYIPYPGAAPNLAVIDKEHCLRFQGGKCDACQKACLFGAIDYDLAGGEIELKAGAVILAAGFDLFDLKSAGQYGYGKIENVYNGFEFERLLNSSGPSKGNILLKNGIVPKKIAFIHCAGSRTKKYNEYCSGVCCMYLLKFARLVKEKLPEVSITGFYSDLCLPGKEAQRFYDNIAGNKEIDPVRVKNPDSIKVVDSKNGILVEYEDIHGECRKNNYDMVVLAASVEPPKDMEALAKLFDIPLDKDGFAAEKHLLLASSESGKEGIFIAGCMQAPKDIQYSVMQGQAAAGNILSRLIPGEKLRLDPRIAVIDEGSCSGCGICAGLCPYNAIACENEKKVCNINEVLCKGCGICVPACPSAAIKYRHFTEKQVTEEIKGLLR